MEEGHAGGAGVISSFADMGEAEARRFMSGKLNLDLRLGMAEVVNGRTLYDIGCGKGLAVKVLYDKDKYLGIDVSPELLRIAESDNPGYRFMRHDMSVSPLSVDDESAEVGLMISVLEHVDDLETAKRIYFEAIRTCKELLVVWHTPPVYDSTELITVPCELNHPIRQNHYERGSFEREDLEVRSERVGGFDCWRVVRRGGLPADFRQSSPY